MLRFANNQTLSQQYGPLCHKEIRPKIAYGPQFVNKELLCQKSLSAKQITRQEM